MNKTERIACLYLTFLNRPYHEGVSFAQIKKLMPLAYQGDAESARRKFERDKEELKNLGLELKYTHYGQIPPGQGSGQEHVYLPAEEICQLPELSLCEEDYRSLAMFILRSLANYTPDSKEYQLLCRAAAKLFYKYPMYIDQDLQNQEGTFELGVKGHYNSEATEDTEQCMEVLHQALKLRHSLKIIYSNHREQKKTYFVSPRGLISYKGRWCLLAYLPVYKDVRRFYVDRMVSAYLSDRPYIADPKFDIHKYSLHPLALPMHRLERVELQVLAEYEETCRCFLQGAKRTFSYYEEEERTFYFETSNVKALFNWMLRHANAVQKIGPQPLQRQFANYLQKVKALYA